MLDIDKPQLVEPSELPKEFNTYNLSCLTDAHPTLTTQNWVWKHNGKLISYGSNLSLPYLTPLNTGLYECFAMNEAGLRSNETSILVECK